MISSVLSRRSSMGQTMLSSSGITSLRDRVNSNRFPERPRMRSNSARMGAKPEVITSGRVSPATEVDGRVRIFNHCVYITKYIEINYTQQQI